MQLYENTVYKWQHLQFKCIDLSLKKKTVNFLLPLTHPWSSGENTLESFHSFFFLNMNKEIFLILGTCKQILDFLCSQYMAKWLRLSASVQLVFVNYKL